MNYNKVTFTSFFLRLAIAVPFLYAAIAALLQPEAWIGFIPGWVQAFIPANLLLPGFSIYEIVLSLWLLSGKKVVYSASVAAVTLALITITNLTVLDIVFRDIGLILAAVALAVLSYKP
ncbi:hypothetical protein HYU22_05345 [Candidatus Woesearchaeota archaeon]|nr:hypothetical protein [Candidatus Woesearchaeota archaeon]